MGFAQTVFTLSLLVVATLVGLLTYLQRPPHGQLYLSTIKGDATVKYVGDHSIPYITGSTKEAVMFAVGFAHAADRLYDLQLKRAMAAGRLAEVFVRCDTIDRWSARLVSTLTNI